MVQSKIVYMFECVQPVREGIMRCLTATDLATFCYAIPTVLTHAEKSKFLNVTRDMPDQQGWIRDRIAEGSKVKVVGKDLDLLMMRIRRPTHYWEMFQEHIKIAVWIVCPSSITMEMKAYDLSRDIERMVFDLTDQDEQDDFGYPYDHNLRTMTFETGSKTMDKKIADMCSEIKDLHDYMNEPKKPPGVWKMMPIQSLEQSTATPQKLSSEYCRNWYSSSTVDRSLVEIIYLDVAIRTWCDPKWLPSSIVNVSEDELSTRSMFLDKGDSNIEYHEENTFDWKNRGPTESATTFCKMTIEAQPGGAYLNPPIMLININC